MNDSPENTYLKKQLADAKFSLLHLKIWLLCSFGIFLDGLDLTMISMALALINKEFHTTALQEGIIAASAILGMMVGSLLGGVISDKVGRKKVYLLDLIAFFVLTLLTAFSPNVTALILLRFLLGIALGADYPASASYISELVPSKIRGKMLAFSTMQFVMGSFFAAIFSLIILKLFPDLASWRIMLGVCAFPALIVGWFRLKMYESPYWLISKGRIDDAIAIIAIFCKKSQSDLKDQYEQIKRQNNSNNLDSILIKLFSQKNKKSLILISLPWFIFDIVGFAIGTFTPIILAMFIHKTKNPSTTFELSKIYTSIEGTAVFSIIALFGYLLGTFAVEKIGRMKLQIMGFVGMAVGLVLLLLPKQSDVTASFHNIFLFLGFSIYYFSANMGPGPVTYILPNELFPTPIRAKAHGFATMSGKFGAFLGILFMPLLIDELDLKNVMIIFAALSLIGAFITFKFGKETMYLDLQ